MDGVRCATALLESVAVAVYLEDVHVIGEAVEQGAGEAFGAKDLGPFLEGQVRSPSPVQRPIGRRWTTAFLLIPPFYTTGGVDISVGHNAFVNQKCTFYDLGGLDIADDVMIGLNVSIITSGHPIEPCQRRAYVIANPS